MDKRHKRQINIRNIADFAGVSIATVSRVINSPETVAEGTRKRVMDAIREYDYVPNLSAKNVFSGSSNSIAIFVYNMANPFYISLVQHLNRVAFENNYTLLICDTGNDPEMEAYYIEYCRGIRVSGLVFTAGATHDFGSIRHLSDSLPVVLIDRAPPKDFACYSIQSDYDCGIAMLIEYLYKLGHRKIGYITGTPGTLSAHQRLTSFTKNINAYGLALPGEYIKQGSFSVEAGLEAFDYFYAQKNAPTAIITADDQIAWGFMMRANALGVSIPNEFSLCGMDASDGAFFYPPITSIKQDIRAIASEAFQCIIHHEKCPPPQEKCIPISIFIGQTCYRA